MKHIFSLNPLIKDHVSFELPPQEIHIWIMDIHSCSHCLPSWDRDTILRPSQRYLCFLLSRYLNISPEYLHIQKTERGKPILRSHPEISFSLAHSRDLLVLAFARDPVGIDLEKKRTVRATAIAKKFFSQHEEAFLRQSPEDHFFYLWTAKEAALKADGCGLARGLRQAITVIKKNRIQGVYLKKRFMTVIPWYLDKHLKNYFIGSLASFVSPSLIRWYDLRGMRKLSY
jgi:phosphopantetheinyl transferase